MSFPTRALIPHVTLLLEIIEVRYAKLPKGHKHPGKYHDGRSLTITANDA